MRPSQGPHATPPGREPGMQTILPIYTKRPSPTASISSLAQLEALTKSISRKPFRSSATAKKTLSPEDLGPKNASQVQSPIIDSPRSIEASAPRTNDSQISISTAHEASIRGETLVTPAESSCADETDGWEGDDEMEEEDDGSNVVMEEKLIEGREADEMQLDGAEESSENIGPGGRVTSIARMASGETQRSRPRVIPPALVEEGNGKPASTKKKTKKSKMRTSRKPWAWRCFLWCCVVERVRDHG